MSMKSVFSSYIYQNPLPQLRARNSAFVALTQLPGGDILALHQMGEAFESVDGTTFVSISHDQGNTWSAPRQAFDKSGDAVPTSDCAKPTLLPDGRIAAFGYQFFRENPELPIGNPETGGLLDDEIYIAYSADNGNTWSARHAIPCAWENGAEASAPLSVLQDGSWASPITGFANWEGKLLSKNCGRLLRSYDNGSTWNDDVICTEFEDKAITCFEQRMCQLEDGTLIVISWNENTETGELLNNHYTFSTDNGKTFSAPLDTGIKGQASFVCALGGTKLLALHSMRREAAEPGIRAVIVDAAGGGWKVLEDTVIWKPNTPIVKDKNMADVFAFLKFGQPSAIVLSETEILLSHWVYEDGMYKTCATKIEL